MNNMIDKFTDEIIRALKERKPKKDYSLLKLKFNPFPPAGLPKFLFLPPLDREAKDKIIHFIRSTYFASKSQEYAGLTIIGEYGMGKTHLMKHIQVLIDNITNVEERKDFRFSAITCFIDKPEDAPQLVVHRIVEQIGLDNIRKYIGKILIDKFSENKKEFYDKFKSRQTLFLSPKKEWDKLFEEPAVSNFLKFLSMFKKLGGDLKLFQEAARNIIKEYIVADSILADRYLDLIFEEKKADLSWDILAGYVTTRNIQRKEVIFLNSVVEILRNAGFHQLYVFVDEFEDISKLKAAKLSNYLTTLTTLINRERRWALVVSLTKEALAKIKEESAPLHDRLTSYSIKLQPLNETKAKNLLINYLNIVREREQKVITPFNEAAIKEMLKIAKGNCRSFILLAHKAIEVALAHNKSQIDKAIVTQAKGLRYDEEYDLPI